MRGNWDRVNKAIYGALSEVTLADMAAGLWSFGVPSEPDAEAPRAEVT
jgi:DNA-binding IscR family transcriptional regulator